MAVLINRNPVISSVEYVLGFLWVRPASRLELLDRAPLVRSPILSRRGVEAALRGLIHQGLVEERGGKLVLARKRLHPAAARVAQVIAEDLRMLGIV